MKIATRDFNFLVFGCRVCIGHATDTVKNSGVWKKSIGNKSNFWNRNKFTKIGNNSTKKIVASLLFLRYGLIASLSRSVIVRGTVCYELRQEAHTENIFPYVKCTQTGKCCHNHRCHLESTKLKKNSSYKIVVILCFPNVICDYDNFSVCVDKLAFNTAELHRKSRCQKYWMYCLSTFYKRKVMFSPISNFFGNNSTQFS